MHSYMFYYLDIQMSEEKKVEIVEDVEGYLEEDESDAEIEVKPKVRKPKTEKQMAAF